MGLTGWAMAAGALTAAGVVILLGQVLAAAPPDLRAALARLDAPPAAAGWTEVPLQDVRSDSGRGRRWWRDRVGHWVATHTPAAGPFSAPTADLRLLGLHPVAFAATRAAASAAGLAVPVVLAGAASLAGVAMPALLPAGVGAGLAVAAWLTCAGFVRSRAAAARSELRVALSAYLDLVALERAGAGSPVEALEAAAEVGHGAGFTLVRTRLALAARAGLSPYTALAGLADEVGVAELRDLADIAATAADGAAVYNSLLAKSRSLRNAVLADAHAAANAASERLVFPVVLLGTGFLLLMFYPALVRLTAGAG